MIDPTMTFAAAEPGTKCRRCPCHPAVIVIDGEALCALCDDDVHPPIAQAKPALPALHPAWSPQPKTAPRDPEPVPAPAPRKEPAMRTNKRLSPELLRAIHDAPVEESTNALAKRLGISGQTCSYQRNKFHGARPKPASAKADGLPSAADLDAVAAEQSIASASTEVRRWDPAALRIFVPGPTAGTMVENEDGGIEGHFVPAATAEAILQREQTELSDDKHNVDKLAADAEAEIARLKTELSDVQAQLTAALIYDETHPMKGCATVTLTICASSIDRWWNHLDLDKKAELFADNFDCCPIVGCEAGRIGRTAEEAR